MRVRNSRFCFSFFPLCVTHDFWFNDKSLVVKYVSIDTQLQNSTEIIQIVRIVEVIDIIAIVLKFGFTVGFMSVCIVIMLIVFVYFIIIMTKLSKVNDIAETFPQSGSIDSFEIEFAFGGQFRVYLLLKFCPEVFCVPDGLNFLRFLNILNNFLNFSFI